MATKTQAPSKTTAAAAAKPKVDAKPKVAVIANPRLVAAIKSYDVALAETQSYLVIVATIIQEEQLTRPEVVASLMEGRGCARETAESQYSRSKALFTRPEVLQKIKDGECTLAQARDNSKKPQTNPSQEVKMKNANLRMAKSIKGIVESAKELAMDLATVVSSLKDAAKKAGLK